MKTTSAVLLTVAIVALGRWAQEKKLDIQVAFALAFIMVAIAVVQELNPKFGQSMAALILVGAVFVYGPDLFNKFNTSPIKGVGPGAVGGGKEFI